MRFWHGAARCFMVGERPERRRTASTGSRKGSEDVMANQLGKMYVCRKCNSQVIVTKGGVGTLKCCSQNMEQKK